MLLLAEEQYIIIFRGQNIRITGVFFHACAVQKPILSLGCLAHQGYWSDLRADTGTLFFADKIQTKHSQTQLPKEEFFVKDGCARVDSWCE